jgi:hypothetical protein
MFDNQIIWIGNNTAEACMNQCAKFGFTAAGVEVRGSLSPAHFILISFVGFLTGVP